MDVDICTDVEEEEEEQSRFRRNASTFMLQHWVSYREDWLRFSAMNGELVQAAFAADESMARHMREKFERELAGSASSATGMFTSCDGGNKRALLAFFFSRDVPNKYRIAPYAENLGWMFVALNARREPSSEFAISSGISGEKVEEINRALSDCNVPIIEAVSKLNDALVYALILDYVNNTGAHVY
jgi:hypothetical protein